MDATTYIPGGSFFTVNDTVYQSDPNDPVRGVFTVNMGQRIAPSFTIGFGNMLKRSSKWTVQTDLGFQLIGKPSFTLVMNGSVCTPTDGCNNQIQSDPGTVSDLNQQQLDVNNAIQILRFFPILTSTISYRFGHRVALTYWR